MNFFFRPSWFMKDTLANLQSKYKIEFERRCLGLIQKGTLKFLQNNLKTLNNILKDSSNKIGLLKTLLIIIITVFCLAAIMIKCGCFLSILCIMCENIWTLYFFRSSCRTLDSYSESTGFNCGHPVSQEMQQERWKEIQFSVKVFQNGQA
jgi:hypothetical protein